MKQLGTGRSRNGMEGSLHCISGKDDTWITVRADVTYPCRRRSHSRCVRRTDSVVARHRPPGSRRSRVRALCRQIPDTRWVDGPRAVDTHASAATPTRRPTTESASSSPAQPPLNPGRVGRPGTDDSELRAAV